MRKTNEYGIPESSEFILELDEWVCRFEKKLQNGEKLTREIIALVDVYNAIGGIEGDGLHSFWEWENHDRVIDSFILVGADDIARTIEQTRWMKRILKKGTDRSGQYKFSEKQDKEISNIEESIYEMFIGLPTRLLKLSEKIVI